MVENESVEVEAEDIQCADCGCCIDEGVRCEDCQPLHEEELLNQQPDWRES